MPKKVFTAQETALIKLLAYKYMEIARAVIASTTAITNEFGREVFREAIHHASKMAFLLSVYRHDVTQLAAAHAQPERCFWNTCNLRGFFAVVEIELAAHKQVLESIKVVMLTTAKLVPGEYAIGPKHSCGLTDSIDFMYRVSQASPAELTSILRLQREPKYLRGVNKKAKHQEMKKAFIFSHDKLEGIMLPLAPERKARAARKRSTKKHD